MEYKEYIIPKKNGKVRKIVAPDEELKTYQRGQIRKLERVFSKEMLKHGIADLDIFHGFIRSKNCITAAQLHIGYQASIMMDISNFFDSVFVNHIPPKYKLHANLFHKDGHAAQGFPSSPMVANIASIPVMAEIVTALDTIFKKSEYVVTIYADDVTISVNDTRQTALVQRIVKRAFNKHGFTINERKTRVKYADYGYRRILGVNVGVDHIRATRKTMRKIRAAKHQARKSKTAARSAGGLVTWSKCILPRKSDYGRRDWDFSKDMQ